MPPEMTAGDVFPWGWLLWADRPEHGTCGGWTFDSRDRRLICSCGAALFTVEQVAA